MDVLFTNSKLIFYMFNKSLEIDRLLDKPIILYVNTKYIYINNNQNMVNLSLLKNC